MLGGLRVGPLHQDDLPQGLATRDGVRRLVLVTCGGPVIERPDGRHYRDTVVAYATPVD